MPAFGGCSLVSCNRDHPALERACEQELGSGVGRPASAADLHLERPAVGRVDDEGRRESWVMSAAMWAERAYECACAGETSLARIRRARSSGERSASRSTPLPREPLVDRRPGRAGDGDAPAAGDEALAETGDVDGHSARSCARKSAARGVVRLPSQRTAPEEHSEDCADDDAHVETSDQVRT